MGSDKDHMERRGKPRIECAYPAVIRGVDSEGKRFSENATLTNISATGLFARLRANVVQDANVFVVFRCSATSPLDRGKAPLVAVKGNVVRSQSSGQPGIAVKINHHRFL